MTHSSQSAEVITAGDRAVSRRTWMLAVAWVTTLLISRLTRRI